MKALKPIFAFLILTASAWSQVNLGTYNGCTATDAQFVRTQISTGNSQPLKMAFDLQANNVVDVYFTQKGGQLKKITGSTGVTSIIGTVPTQTGNEDGLIGIALDPAFKTNRNIFLYYAFNGTTESSFRLSRFTLTVAGALDLTSEKILIKIPSVRGRWHTSGAMQFDAYGDLWETIGDNEEQENGPANTADMRGGIIRIHPDNSAKGYSIPAGNFGAAMAARYATSNPTLAAQYADPAKVLPEIYVKGTRNAYTITLDPVRRWVTWGDVGPDQGQVSEEYNLEKAPDYMGWPYFAGSQSMGGVTPYGNVGQPAIPNGIVKTAPINNFAGLTGVRNLPAVNDPIYAKNESCAMSGPIFRYNGANSNSADQFPPQMNRKWFLADCNGGATGYGYHMITLNATGDAITADQRIWAGYPADVLTDMEMGPEGAFYIAQQGSGRIDKIAYTGTCADANLLLEQPTSLTSRPATPEWLKVGSRTISIVTPGPHSIRISDLQGRTVLKLSGDGVQTHSLPVRDAGVYYLTVTSSKGTATSVLPPF